MQLLATDEVAEKLKDKHGVEVLEAEEAFFNHEGPYLIDDREKHKSNSPTVWFISETFSGRVLKVVMIPFYDQGLAVLRTAYEPSIEEIELYEANR